MEFKKEIVQNVSNEIKSLFSHNINSLVNVAVNERLEKEKEIFYEKLNVCQEEFLEPKGSGLFRYCGECEYCQKNYQTRYNDIHLNQFVQPFGLNLHRFF